MKTLIAICLFSWMVTHPGVVEARTTRPVNRVEARAKCPVFKVDSLKIDLRTRYNSSYNRARIKRSVRQKLLKMKRCFVSVVRTNPKYDGFLWVATTFDKRGKVTEKTITTTVKNAVAKQCIEWMINFWKLPRGMVGRANAQVHIYAQ